MSRAGVPFRPTALCKRIRPAGRRSHTVRLASRQSLAGQNVQPTSRVSYVGPSVRRGRDWQSADPRVEESEPGDGSCHDGRTSDLRETESAAPGKSIPIEYGLIIIRFAIDSINLLNISCAVLGNCRS